MSVVVPFPSAKNRRKVRAVASEAIQLDGRRASRFIGQVCRSLFLDLTVGRGVAPRIARMDVQAFQEAVQAEIIRQTYCVHETGGTA